MKKKKITFEELCRIVVESIQSEASVYSGGGGMGGYGGSNPKSGTSAWSSPMDMMTDEDEEGQGLWQNQLSNLNSYRSS